MQSKTKIAVAVLAVGVGYFASLIHYEGERLKPYPDSGGKPSIGIGATVYEDGTPVTMADKPITHERAISIAKHHVAKDEQLFKQSLPGVKLSQTEYDVYMDFTYNFGQANWRSSSMRRLLIQGKHRQACDALLKWKYVAGRDCSIRKNNCYGVWRRQVDRHSKCVAVN